MDKFISIIGKELSGLWATPDFSVLNETISNIEKTGFGLSVIACAIGAPFVLLSLLYMVWKIANVGPVRKTLSTIFILVLFPII